MASFAHPHVAAAPRAASWRVVVVDGDRVALAACARTIRGVGRFDVVAELTSGAEALALLAGVPCDLLVLDLGLHDVNGIALLRRLRARGCGAEVIALTAVSSAAAVRAALHVGALDYIVKSAGHERLRQALGMFLIRAAALDGEVLGQAEIDRACAAGRLPRRWLPKGLSTEVVGTVRAQLSPDAAVTAADVSARTGLSRVTARRYLEYLVATDQASVTTAPAGPGRPRKLYRPAWTR